MDLRGLCSEPITGENKRICYKLKVFILFWKRKLIKRLTPLPSVNSYIHRGLQHRSKHVQFHSGPQDKSDLWIVRSSWSGVITDQLQTLYLWTQNAISNQRHFDKILFANYNAAWHHIWQYMYHHVVTRNLNYEIIHFATISEVFQNEFRYDFRKGPREISAGTVFTVFTCIMAFNTVITVPAEISRGPFRKSYRNSFCKTSLFNEVCSQSVHREHA